MPYLELSGQDMAYLDGRAFSNGRSFRVNSGSAPLDRLALLESLSRDQRVLHIGFADHSVLIADKMNTSQWLHGRLINAAKSCVGVDIDEEAVDQARELGVPDVYALNLLNPDPRHPVLEEEFDVVILGEVLEHIPAPAEFLEAVTSTIGRPGQRIVVTVPNAWSYRALRSVAKGHECINTDHRFWFTPYTLAKLFVDSGLAVERIMLCPSPPPPTPTSFRGRAAHRVISGKAGQLVKRRFAIMNNHVVGIGTVPDA